MKLGSPDRAQSGKRLREYNCNICAFVFIRKLRPRKNALSLKTQYKADKLLTEALLLSRLSLGFQELYNKFQSTQRIFFKKRQN